jgi:hypothetical protein
VVSNPRSNVQSITLSADQAARKAEISYATLRRWLANGDFQTWLASEKKAPLGYLRLGKTRKIIWRFSSDNMLALVEFKEQVYCKGRGLAGRLREQVKRERNSRKAWKRMLQRLNYRPSPEEIKQSAAKERARNLIFRRYDAVLKDLAKINLWPKNPDLDDTKPKKLIPDPFETPPI